MTFQPVGSACRRLSESTYVRIRRAPSRKVSLVLPAFGAAYSGIVYWLSKLGQASEAGLVAGDRRGKWVWYSFNEERLADLLATLQPVGLMTPASRARRDHAVHFDMQRSQK